MKRVFPTLVIAAGLQFFLINITAAQQVRRCNTSEYLRSREEKHPGTIEQLEKLREMADEWVAGNDGETRNTYVIPVVVHVVWHTNSQNITDEKIQSQIDVLNEDFNRYNADTANTPSAWKSIAGSIPVTFCLAAYDPEGNETNGIERVFTDHESFGIDDDVKHLEQGGADAWPTNHYLNIWVCNLEDNVLGYALTSPGSPEDGVVITYNAFGRIPPLKNNYDEGRTCTHEVGHWLGLSHTFGDDSGSCSGSDNCSDTPNEASEVYGCPQFPLLDACSPSSPGVMFMNYMDYTNDACMNIYTVCQMNKALGMLNTSRQSLQNSPASCQGIQFNLDAAISTIVFPEDTVTEQGFEAQVQLSNRGATDITHVRITYQVDGQEPASFEYNETLPSLASTVVTLPAYFTGEGGHEFFAWTSEPNFGTDEFIFNDTASHDFLVSSNINKNTIIVAADNSGNQVTVNLKNPSAQEMNVRLVNTVGQVVLEGNWDVLNQSVITFDLSHYPNGMYFFYGKIGYDYVIEKILLVRN